MRRAAISGLGLVAVFGAGTASADPVGPSWHTTSGSYYAVGQGAATAARAGAPRGPLYAASGIDARGVARDGHGGFVRFEQGRLHEAPALADAGPHPVAADPYVLALDLGYAYGLPLIGAWGEQGLVGFVEVGLSGWHAHGPDASTEAGQGEVLTSLASGFGVALGASVEARYGRARFGIAVQRREIPVFLGGVGRDGHASSMTLQLRLGADL